MKFDNTDELGLPTMKGVIPPEGGWEPWTLYEVEVSFRSTNPVHVSLLMTGFLKEGKPHTYTEVWSNSYDRSYDMGQIHYLKANKKLWTRPDR